MVQPFNPNERNRKLDEMLENWDQVLKENEEKIKEIKDYGRLSSSL